MQFAIPAIWLLVATFHLYRQIRASSRPVEDGNVVEPSGNTFLCRQKRHAVGARRFVPDGLAAALDMATEKVARSCKVVVSLHLELYSAYRQY